MPSAQACTAGLTPNRPNHQRATQWLLRTEGTRLARYESRVFDYFDACTIISQNDRLLIQHRDRDRIHLIPNGVDLEAFANNPGGDCEELTL